MIDWTKPIETSDGTPARYLGRIDRGDIKYPNAIAVGNPGAEFLETADDEGKINSGFFVANVPEKVRGFVNVYKHSNGSYGLGSIFPTALEADRNASGRIVARFRLEVPEGRFDK